MDARCDRALVWFRRDLRDHDHAALYHALRSGAEVWCAFVFDTEILDALPSREDRRVEFIWESLRELAAALEAKGGGLIVRHGMAREEIPRLAAELGVDAVFANRDYEPAAIHRDRAVAEALRRDGCSFHDFKDHVIFENPEVQTAGGRPYTVFTPYKRAWLKKLEPLHTRAYPVGQFAGRLRPAPGASRLPPLEALGFRRTNLPELAIPTGMSGAARMLADFHDRIALYHECRDLPGVKGVSYLGAHLRFGTLSVREAATLAIGVGGRGAETWLTELIWRDFFSQILATHPHVAGHAFRPELEHVAFRNDERLFRAWCEGRTGYPLVDAGMRQLNATGYMHNRVRMVAASFLVKDLHVDWRWGERYFAETLLDFDLASNNGNWQWAASTGCDAQPWFRIFNPVLQSRKFDPQGRFIRRYVPEIAKLDDARVHEPWTLDAAQQKASGVRVGRDYPAPVVEHASARQVALQLYRQAAQSAGGTPPCAAPPGRRSG